MTANICGYEFGDFLLDVTERQLYHHGHPIILRGKKFDLLLYFLQHPRKRLDVADLIDKVKLSSHVPQLVKKLRNALNDPDPFIETIYGEVAYRLAIQPLPLTEAELAHRLKELQQGEPNDSLALATNVAKKHNPHEPYQKPHGIIGQSSQNDSSRLLTPNWNMTQGLSYWEPDLGEKELKSVACTVVTDSPYIRFGFKLMCKDGRTFGDSIKTSDTNLLIHIGRNDWDRPQAGIRKEDIFLTCYFGVRTVMPDRKLFRADTRFAATVELRIDPSHTVELLVNDSCCFTTPIPTEICRRVAIMAWADNNPYEVFVSDFSVETS